MTITQNEAFARNAAIDDAARPVENNADAAFPPVFDDSNSFVVRVRMMAFEDLDGDGNPKTRPVRIPAAGLKGELAVLNRVFFWGQNDFQPRQFCSVSVGDVIEWKDPMGLDALYVVCNNGFRLINPAEWESYKALDRRDRQFCDLVENENVGH